MTPTAMVRPRLAYWSPLPPQASGIADYSAQLLEHLAAHFAIEVFVDDEAAKTVRPSEHYAVLAASAYDRRQAQAPFAANLYQMGNHEIFHAQTYQQLRRESGVVALHDLLLTGFYWGLYRDRPETYLDEIEFNYGLDTRKQAADRLLRGEPVDPFELGLERRVVEASLGVIVHSQWAARRLEARYPDKPVVVIPHGAGPPQAKATDVRAKHGWGPNHLVVGAFGSKQTNKRLHVLLEAFAAAHARQPSLRLLLAGREPDPTYAQRIRMSLRGAPHKEAVVMLGEVPLDELENCLRACDVVVNLRWPTTGETSGILLRAFGAGKAVLTSDIPQFREFPERFCWRVPAETATEAEEIARRLTHAATHLGEVRAAGQEASEYTAGRTSWPDAARQYAAVLEAAPGWAARYVAPAQRRASGVNVVGDLQVDAGLGVAAGNLLAAMRKQGVPASLVEVRYKMSSRSSEATPTVLQGLPQDAIYPINLLTLNIHEVGVGAVPEEQLRAILGGRYTIGNWFWELPELPAHYGPAFDYVDEIWAPSTHTQASLQAATDKPVRVVPVPVEVLTSPEPRRAAFGLPEEQFVFLASFSATSCHARKNPFGLVEAFERAFPNTADRPKLVLRAHHVEYYKELHAALLAAVERVGGMILPQAFTRQQMNDLLACADAYVSLHRGEGFGLGMAESMYLGKPVIGTHYSGNADFMTEANSYPVKYRLRQITEEDHVYQPLCPGTYRPGAWWAEPDLDHAAACLRAVYTEREAARAKGRRAAADIRRYCSPAVVGRQVEARLVEIEAMGLARRGVMAEAPAAASAARLSATQVSDAAYNLLTFYRQSMNDYLQLHRNIERVPFGLAGVRGVSLLLVTLKRIRRLGHLRAKQVDLNSAAHETANLLAHSQATQEALLARLIETMAALPSADEWQTERRSMAMQLAEQQLKLRQLEQEVAHLAQAANGARHANGTGGQ